MKTFSPVVGGIIPLNVCQLETVGTVHAKMGATSEYTDLVNLKYVIVKDRWGMFLLK